MKKIILISRLICHSYLKRHFSHAAIIVTALLLSAIPFDMLMAQADTSKPGITTAYDEIPVKALVESYGGINLNVIYTSDDLLYINVEELYKSLKINCDVSPSGDKIKGFIADEDNNYLIDHKTGEITVGDKVINTRKGLVKEMGILYLESSLFAKAFGISISFNLRSLTCIIKSSFELPVIKELRLEKMHSNIRKIKGEIKADSTLKRNYHLFKFGMADWAFSTSQSWKQSTFNRASIGVGTELFFGEANLSVNYSSQNKFDGRQINYLWRWIDNEKKLIKQAQVGKISTNMISFINAPVIGAAVRNTPTTVRKASGYYNISETTEPNWQVELYINNELVDYTKADASGLFMFKVPIVYGYTTLKLRYYGPLGEERMEERSLNTAFTLMPEKEFEYGLSAGVLQDSIRTRMSRAEFNYGVKSYLTIGGGVEYLSSIKGAPSIPFAKLTFQPISKLILNMDYAHEVKAHAMLNYYLQKNAFLEIEFSRFKEGQKAIPFNALQELKAKFSMPLRFKTVGAFATIDYSDAHFRDYNYKRAAFSLSGYFKQYSINSSTELISAPLKTLYKRFTRSTLAFSVRLKQGIAIRPSAIFNFTERKVVQYNIEIEKRIKNGFVSLSYQQNPVFKSYSAGINLKYDLRFLRTSLSSFVNNGTVTTTQSAQGSMAFGGANGYSHASKFSSTGKGGISIYPFLDLNENGVFDEGEHLVKLNSVKIASSNVSFSKKDSIIRVAELYSFTNYNLQFNDRDLENISWRFKHHIYKVLIDPNQYKRVDIPVIVMGEANGTVYMNADNILKGTGRILIKFYKNNSTVPVAETLSETDGYAEYLGFTQGEYTARVDSAQLKTLGLSVSPLEIKFTIKATEEGDIARMGNFILKKEEQATVPQGK
jgi:hypothetical protein